MRIREVSLGAINSRLAIGNLVIMSNPESGNADNENPETEQSDDRLRWRHYVLRQCPLIPKAVKLFAVTMAEYSANGERCHPGWELLKTEAGYAKSTTYSLENACVAWGILVRDGGPHQFTISLPADASIEWPKTGAPLLNEYRPSWISDDNEPISDDDTPVQGIGATEDDPWAEPI
jgi:hypothetical protein